MQTKLSWKFRDKVSLRGLLLFNNIAWGRKALVIHHIRARGVDMRGGWNPPANLLTQKAWFFCRFYSRNDPF